MNERRIGAALTYVQTALHIVISLLYVPLLLSGIGQSEYGMYQLVGSIMAYIGITETLLSAGVLRFYCKYKAVGDATAMENTLATAQRIYRILSAAVLAAGGIGGAIAYRQGKQPVQETMQTEATMQTRLTIPPETQAETPAAPPAETEALMEPQPGGELVMQQFGQSVHTVYFTMGIPELFYTPREPSEIQQKVPELYWENGHVLSGRYPVRFEARDGTGDSIVVIGREGSYEVPLPADFLAQELDSVQLGALADTEYPVDTEHWEINPDLPPTFTAQRADFSGEKDGKACTGTVIYWETAMDERYPVVGSVYFFDFSGTRAEDYAAAEGSLLITELTVNKRDHVLPTVDVNKIPKEFLP